MEEHSQIVDRESALASVGGDAEFLREIAGLIQAAWPTLLNEIRNDLAAGDLTALEGHARLARAAAEYVAAKRAYMTAIQLQFVAMQKDLEGARRVAANLEGEVARLSLLSPASKTPFPAQLPRLPPSCPTARKSALAAWLRREVISMGHIGSLQYHDPHAEATAAPLAPAHSGEGTQRYPAAISLLE